MIEGNGTLPAGWRIAKLGEVCRITMGQSPEGSSYNSDSRGDPLLNGPTEFGEKFPRPVQWTTAPTKFAEPGDILLCVRATIGKKNIADRRYCIGRGLAAIRGIDQQATTDFLWFALDVVTQKLLNQTAGSTFPNLPGEKLKRVEIPLPPLEEQRRIAARLLDQLSILSDARAALEAQLAAAESLPAAHLRAVFQSEEAKLWPIKRMGDYADIAGGIQKTPSRAPVRFHKAFLTVRNVQRGFLDLSKIERFEVTESEFERCRLMRGDLLIVEGNGSIDHIGRNALFNEGGEWIHQNHIIRVRLSRKAMLPEFVSAYLNSDIGRVQLIEKARTTTGLYTLSAGKIATLEIPSPTVAEQNAIAAQLSASSAASAQLQCTLRAKLAELEKLPATLLRSAFCPVGY